MMVPIRAMEEQEEKENTEPTKSAESVGLSLSMFMGSTRKYLAIMQFKL